MDWTYTGIYERPQVIPQASDLAWTIRRDTEIRDMKSPRGAVSAIEKTRRRMKVSYDVAAKPL